MIEPLVYLNGHLLLCGKSLEDDADYWVVLDNGKRFLLFDSALWESGLIRTQPSTIKRLLNKLIRREEKNYLKNIILVVYTLGDTTIGKSIIQSSNPHHVRHKLPEPDDCEFGNHLVPSCLDWRRDANS